MTDIADMRAWPTPQSQRAQEQPASIAEPIEYHEDSTASLADRCARSASDWGGGDKVAQTIDPILLWKDPEAHPLALMLMTLDRYGPGCLEWAPEVLRVTMMRDGLQVSGPSWDKILACRVILSSPSPWRQWEVFHWMSRALSGRAPNFMFLEHPNIGHLFTCADVMKTVDPRRETAEEVDKFVGAALRQEGHVIAPESLSFAQRVLDAAQLSCKSCGALFPDQNDTKCVSCAATTLHREPSPFAQLKQECETLWRPRRAKAFAQAIDGLPDSPAGNLTYDLLFHWDHALRTRHQLVAQLRGLSK